MIRTRELCDDGWKSFKGDMHIPQWIKMGVIGVLTDNRPRQIQDKDQVAFMVADLVTAESWTSTKAHEQATHARRPFLVCFNP